MTGFKRPLIAAAMTAALLLPASTLAQDEADAEAAKTWEHTADLSYVLTAGNSESSTLGFSWKSIATWERSSLEIAAGGIRAQTTTTTRTASGDDPNNPTVDEQSTKATTAENYFFAARYDRTITKKLFWFAGTSWMRNEFAGIKDRFGVEGGVGNAWRDDDHMKFKTFYALSYIDQTDVIVDPTRESGYVGIRLAYEYEHNMGENTTFNSGLVWNGNAEDSPAWFANWLNSVTVNMSKKLALKASLLFLYNNRPALESIPFTPTPPAIIPTEVNVPLDELDTIFTTSLVIKF